MPDDALAAAVERYRRQRLTNGTYAVADLERLADAYCAYLAREADDAKPVDRDWLVSVLGREPDSYENYIEHWESQHGGGCFTWAPGDCCRWCGDFAEFELETRGDVLAMMRLARWPTNETGGE